MRGRKTKGRQTTPKTESTRREANPTRDLRPRLLALEDKADVEARKEMAKEPLRLERTTTRCLPMFEPRGVELPIFTRPPWTYDMTKDELERQEQAAFRVWMDGLITTHGKALNFFESNIETWRQFWRVVERSSVVLFVVDTRFGDLQVNMHAVEWIRSQHKSVGVVLNKGDLVDEWVMEKWHERFERLGIPSLPVKTNRGFAGRTESFGLEERRETRLEEEGYVKTTVDDFERFVLALHTQRSGGTEERLCVGFVGNPNVGKSSLLNWLVQKKVTSVSAHPGRTKHLQTYNLTPRVMLCDCPGMVFPMLQQPQLIQVVFGTYPLSQLREPYSIVRWFVEHLPLDKTYGIALEDGMSVYGFVERFAIKKRYVTGKAGRPDLHRAACEILKDCMDGRVIFMFEPEN